MAFGLCVTGEGGGLAAQPEGKPEKSEVISQFEKLQGELKEAQEGIESLFGKAKGEELQQLTDRYFHLRGQYAQKYFDLVKNQPEKAESVAILIEVVNVADSSPVAQRAADLLIEHHLGHESVRSVVPRLGASPYPAAEKLLRALLEKAEEKEDRGKVHFALAEHYRARLQIIQSLQRMPADKQAVIKNRIGEELFDRMLKTKPAELEELAGPHYERVIKDHADVEQFGEKLGKRAETALFEMRHLGIGKKAPEIEGEDLDGKPLKLSDYRGKVILLDFWGSWCGPCRVMMPHARELAKRLEGKPFALVGVNSDETRDKAKALIEKEGITWRSFWNGGGPGGPISTRWNIQGWPTLYLIDHEGVIRHKFIGSPGEKTLDEAVDELIAAVPK
jgi:thiol-disulfide isomerase/thioredoxin